MSFPATPDGLAAVPLVALPAIALDTETTGLDPAQDRIVELAAVRIADGAVAATGPFATLVAPGRPIPPVATGIHGLADADVAGAPAFPQAIAGLAAWSGASVVLGWSVGFDLAVLRAEHERHGLAWRPPRSLDVAHLVRLVGPQLPSTSLETAAAWLGIEVAGRHRALADARLAADVYLALLPRLRAKGIVTLAQAERALRGLGHLREGEARAGWDEAAPPERVADFARIDSFLYRHRVADLMHAPPVTVDPAVPLGDAIARMAAQGIGSLFVVPAGGGDAGIVTERDVVRALAAGGAAALARPVDGYAQRPLVTLAADEYAYRALGLMTARGFRHLGVTVDGRLAGALGMRDLLRRRSGDAVLLGEAIEQAATPAALGRVWAALNDVVRALAAEQVDARDIAAIVSRELRALTRRAAELAEAELAAAGQGGPPSPFAVLVLGSGGRGESLLAMDQDNAVVHRDAVPAGAAGGWFEAFGRRLSDILAEAGVAYCKGGVMASNPAWRRDLDGWRREVGSWVARSRPEDVLNCDIFYDMVAVHGDAGLADLLHGEALERAAASPAFLKFLALHAADLDPPVGWFGRLRLTDGRIDLKRHGLMPIFSAARVAALRHRIAARSTPERIAALRPLSVASDRTLDDLVAAHRLLLDLVLRQQLADLAAGVPLSNRVAPAALDDYGRQQLRWALDQVPRIADVLGTPLQA